MRARAALLVAALSLTTARSAAEPAPSVPHLHLMGPRTVCKPDTTPPECRLLPPGHFVDEPSWSLLDNELRRLQDAETRLTAENHSLRETTKGWRPGWKILGSTLITGIFIGWRASR